VVSVLRRPSSHLDHLHLLLVAGPKGTIEVADLLGVSVPTAARAIARLRGVLAGDGMELASVRTKSGWHYEIRGLEDYMRRRWKSSRLRRAAGMSGPWKSMQGRGEDDILYGS
jgi:hypothetical protein